MKINSELPLCMLGTEYDINEYEFILFHLFKSNKQYHDYFMDLRKNNPDRLMIFDNSAYEFFVRGETLNLSEYAAAICELKPQIYILPDVLMDMDKTVRGVLDFRVNYSNMIPEECIEMAVLQGNSKQDMLNCLELYNDMGITHIAIPFHNSFLKEMGRYAPTWIEIEFRDIYNDLNDDILYAMGRIYFMSKYEEYFKNFKYIHMLGSHCPLEKVFYSDYNSMDTGYPVKLGYIGIELFKEKAKPNIIIDDFCEKKLSKEQKQLISENIKLFKEL